ncbi:hypothetical protein ACVR0A_06735 [Streptococcus downei]|uniref:Uncharacterized protein n=1 Tax=Streptococcus downei MFe28 TaxID=764290 RepID=A0A380JFL8_STRDO|nr:hypothetical protein [Streptococcus downei]SUN37185.1 Uncharacterised protein [Streptococcus downei MFe28]
MSKAIWLWCLLGVGVVVIGAVILFNARAKPAPQKVATGPKPKQPVKLNDHFTLSEADVKTLGEKGQVTVKLKGLVSSQESSKVTIYVSQVPRTNGYIQLDEYGFSNLLKGQEIPIDFTSAWDKARTIYLRKEVTNEPVRV